STPHHTSSHVGLPADPLILDDLHIYLAIVLLVRAHYSDKLGIRSAFIYAGLLLLPIGYFINISGAPNSVKIVIGSYASFPGVIVSSRLGNNLADRYKRAIGMAFHIGFGNFSGAIAANVYRSQDSPGFILGHALELMFVCIGLIVVPIFVISYGRINHERDEALQLRIERGGKLHLSIQYRSDIDTGINWSS
ncbi:hypothetical protein J3R83DRAFT_7747, partial [Lanmaoa asiatica]